MSMKTITTTTEEFDTDGNIIKKITEVVEEVTNDWSYPYIPYIPYMPYKPQEVWYSTATSCLDLNSEMPTKFYQN